VPALIRQIDVVDAADHSKIIASFSGAEVINRMRTLVPQPADDATIEPNAGRLFYIELTFKSAETIPRALEHHLHFDGAANPGRRFWNQGKALVGESTCALARWRSCAVLWM
jgi:hypothetical protein